MANITVPIQVNLPDDWIEQIVSRLQNDPESEWAEIVRCKDCKHYKTTGNFKAYCDDENFPDEGQKELPEWWFCAGGKRKGADNVSDK